MRHTYKFERYTRLISFFSFGSLNISKHIVSDRYIHIISHLDHPDKPLLNTQDKTKQDKRFVKKYL